MSRKTKAKAASAPTPTAGKLSTNDFLKILHQEYDGSPHGYSFGHDLYPGKKLEVTVDTFGDVDFYCFQLFCEDCSGHLPVRYIAPAKDYPDLSEAFFEDIWTALFLSQCDEVCDGQA